MKKPRQFRIDVDLLKRFDKVNEKLAVNGSEVVRRMIENYVEKNERRMMKMKKDEFLKVANGKYEVDGYVIQYSDVPNYEWYAIVNGKLVDVSEHQWNDFDEFIDVVIEEFINKGGNNMAKNFTHICTMCGHKMSASEIIEFMGTTQCPNCYRDDFVVPVDEDEDVSDD